MTDPDPRINAWADLCEAQIRAHFAAVHALTTAPVNMAEAQRLSREALGLAEQMDAMYDALLAAGVTVDKLEDVSSVRCAPITQAVVFARAAKKETTTHDHE